LHAVCCTPSLPRETLLAGKIYPRSEELFARFPLLQS
jgi:hypothetical protein